MSFAPTSSAGITADKFAALLAKAKMLAQAHRDKDVMEGVRKLEQQVKHEKPDYVDLSLAGITSDTLKTSEGQEAAVDIIHEIVGDHKAPLPHSPVVTNELRKTGVAADVTLNKKQQAFIEQALTGEDIVLIGAAGTGKTTVTGKFLKTLIAEETLRILAERTRDSSQGVAAPSGRDDIAWPQ